MKDFWIWILLPVACLGVWGAYRFGAIPAFGGRMPRLLIGFRGHIQGVVFGRNTVLTVAYSPAKAEGHIAVFGGSGSGKTSAVLIPTLRHWPGTVFTIDISGDIAPNACIPNKLEYGPENPASIPYNIFEEIDKCKDPAAVWEQLERLAFLMMPEKSGKNDNGAAEFFNTEGRKMLTSALICYYNLGFDFIEICETIISFSWRDLLNDIAKKRNPKANQYISSFSGASEQNNAGCKQALDSAIKLFGTNEVIKKTMRRPCEGEAYFAPCLLESHSVFVTISDSKLALYAPLMQIITAQVLDYFSDRPKEHSTKILLCLDEFASLGKLDILSALRKLRKKHVRILVCTQSLADFDLEYGAPERKAMMANFDFKVVLGAGDAETQDYFSKLIGDDDKSHSIFLQKIQGSTGREPARRLVPAATFGKLKNKLVVITPDGYKKLRKNYYYRRF